MEVYAQDEDHENGYTADIRSKYGDPVRDQLTGQVLQIPENFNEITNPAGPHVRTARKKKQFRQSHCQPDGRTRYLG